VGLAVGAAAEPGSALQALVDGAIASGARSLTIPPGDYLFNASRDNFKCARPASATLPTPHTLAAAG